MLSFFKMLSGGDKWSMSESSEGIVQLTSMKKGSGIKKSKKWTVKETETVYFLRLLPLAFLAILLVARISFFILESTILYLWEQSKRKTKKGW